MKPPYLSTTDYIAAWIGCILLVALTVLIDWKLVNG